MTWRAVTVVVILVAPFVIGAYDLIALLVAGNEVTISRVCLDAAHRRPGLMLCVAFLLGVLCGHLFVPQHVSN